MTDERPGNGPSSPSDLEVELLGGPRRYTRDEISAAAGVSVEQARVYWRALGFADVGDNVVAFTDADLAALALLLDLVRSGAIDEHFAINVTRALGHTMARLVDWQVESLVEHLTEQGKHSPDEAARLSVGMAADHLVELERLLVYVWRRQLAAVAGRALATADADGVRGWCSVGFADLVSFTRLSQRLEERELGQLVSRFQSRSNDVVAASGGRVVKTVGDEVLFVADRVEDAADIALSLAESMAADPVLPDVRVGLATGVVVSRLGDVFGRTVNLASRLTGGAQPGCVLVDRATAAALAGHPSYVVDREQVRAVRGLGLVEPGILRRRMAEPAPTKP